MSEVIIFGIIVLIFLIVVTCSWFFSGVVLFWAVAITFGVMALWALTTAFSD